MAEIKYLAEFQIEENLQLKLMKRTALWDVTQRAVVILTKFLGQFNSDIGQESKKD